MRVGVPDALIIKLVSVYALATRSVAHGSVSTLHHEVLDDAMEFVSLVVEIAALLASAVHAEVLSRLGYSLVEQFHDYATLFVALLAFFADFDVEVDLLVCLTKLRKRVKLWSGGLLVVVNALCKELLHCGLLGGTFLSFSFLDDFEVISKILVFGIKLYCILDVFHGLIDLGGLKECDTAQVERFYRLFVKIEGLCAAHDCFLEVARVVRADAQILKRCNLQFLKLVVVGLGSLRMRNSVAVVALSLLVKLTLKLDVSILLEAQSSRY
jgi:hypothetical protein